MDDTSRKRMVGARFEIQRLLGQGSQGKTWLARDVVGSQLVALKELSLKTAESWKAIELFEREGRALQALDHPAIPRYVEAFTERDTDGSARFYLAQEYVEGQSLEDELATRQWTESDARDLCGELLRILDVLHRRSPPVVHRDIKPSNLMRRAADGKIALIDFGAVQRIAPEESGGSTVVGTAGYMPMEQYMGKATPASDLYAVGATLVRLLSRRPPTELPLSRSRIVFEDAVNVSDDFALVLRKLLEPDVEDRYQEASDALADLASPPLPAAAPHPTDPDAHSLASELVAAHRAALAVAEVATTPPMPVPDRPTGPLATLKRYALITAVAATFGGLGQTCLFVQPRACGGGVDPVISAIESCPKARQALGSDIRQAFVGLSCVHNSESQGDCAADSWSGSAHGSLAVRGSKARGSVSFSQRMDGCSNWSLSRGVLSVDGREIDLRLCREIADD